MAARTAEQRARDLDLDSFADEPDRPTQPLTAEQQLVAAIVRQALTDARRAKHQATRRQAVAFLSGSPALKFWCHVAGVRTETVARLADRLLQERMGAQEPPVVGRRDAHQVWLKFERRQPAGLNEPPYHPRRQLKAYGDVVQREQRL